jgi:ketosteroid isomerase-like protein
VTATTGAQADQRELLLQAYAAYNSQDAAALVALISDDVDWPDDDAGRLHGKDEVRAYWTEQWARTRTHDEPVGFSERNDGRTAVHISQVVRSLDGPAISKGQFLHLHRIEGGRIVRMDIEAPRSRHPLRGTRPGCDRTTGTNPGTSGPLKRETPRNTGRQRTPGQGLELWAADRAIPVSEPNMAPVQAKRPIAHPAESG